MIDWLTDWSSSLFALTANRALNFAEFVELMRRVVKERNDGDNDVLDAIRVFDDEQTGFICLTELREAFRRMPGRRHVRGAELEEVWERAMPSEDGKISVEGSNITQ